MHGELREATRDLWHAANLRATYIRQSRYSLDDVRYGLSKDTCCRISFFATVPKSSGFLASLEATSDEHKVGAGMFNRVHFIFEMHTMRRFRNAALLSISQKIR